MRLRLTALICLYHFLSAASAQTVPRIYVYELPDYVTADTLKAPYQQSWLLSVGYEYEADLWVYQTMVNGPWRVRDPEQANIFYIPVLPTRFLHQTLSSTVGWHEALQLSGQHLELALTIVQKLPYWARRNGRDHFVAMTADSARCTHLRALPRSLWGDLGFFMHLGDLTMREEGIPCFDPDSDILMPAHNPLQHEPLTDVYSRVRNITVLYRFGTTGPTASHPYHTRLIRPELLKEHETNPVLGSNWDAGSVNETMEDMSSSIFCVCPPGIVAHTSRFWRALRRGCIPVTFFRAYQLPFSGVLDYSKATVNIQPDNIHTLHQTLTGILNNRSKLQALQKEVNRIQKLLVWEARMGIQDLFAGELSKHIAKY